MSSEAEWLNDMFLGPARDAAALPEWARPVLTPPVAASRGDRAADTRPADPSPLSTTRD